MFRPIAKITDHCTALDKKNKGAFSAEWQIIGGNITISDEILNIIPITSVHTLLEKGFQVELEKCIESDFVDHETAELYRRHLVDACVVAESCAIRQGFAVKVVAHIGNTTQNLIGEILNFVQYLLCIFPHITLAIENEMIINIDGITRLSCGPNDVPCFIRRVRKNLPENMRSRLGSVLDICHALSTIRIKNHIFGFDDNKDELLQLEKYFVSGIDTCLICHFNNLQHYGIGKEHGTGFFNEEERFFDFLKLYQKYIPESDLVFEIREDDYSDAKNFENAIQLLKKNCNTPKF